MARVILNGEPGTAFVNDTGKVLFQFHASFINTCGVCLQYHNAVGPWFPIPLHRMCRCVQTQVPPGAAAAPFVDFREVLAGMNPSQQTAAVGAANYRLIRAGVVDWADVVAKTRVRDLREVVSIKRLSVKAMTAAGVPKTTAETAYGSVHTPAHAVAAAVRAEQIARLKAAGYRPADVARAVSERLAARVSVGAGPSGASAAKVTPGPLTPLTPAEVGAKLGVRLKKPGRVAAPAAALHPDPGVDAAMKRQRAANADAARRTPVVSREVETPGAKLYREDLARVRKESADIRKALADRKGEYDEFMGRWKAAEAKARMSSGFTKPTRAEWAEWLKDNKATYDELEQLFVYGPSRLAHNEGRTVPRLEKGLAAALAGPAATKVVAYAEALARHPDLIPPGPIAERLRQYEAGDAKVKAVVNAGERRTAEVAAVEAERKANFDVIAKNLESQADLVGKYALADAPIPPAVQAEVERIYRETEALVKANEDLYEKVQAARDRHRDEVAKILRVANGAAFTHTAVPAGQTNGDGEILRPITPDTAKGVAKAQAWLGEVVARGDTEGVSVMIGQRPGARAHYSGLRGYIQVDAGEKADVVVHEYGHAIDHVMRVGPDSAIERTLEFLDHRVGDETPVDMRAKFGAGDPGEMGRKDKFDTVFDDHSAHYTGKVYGGGAAEVLSMGLQLMFNDPLKFATKDPEFFKFIAGIADGSLR